MMMSMPIFFRKNKLVTNSTSSGNAAEFPLHNGLRGTIDGFRDSRRTLERGY